jgi:hypothetical protein
VNKPVPSPGNHKYKSSKADAMNVRFFVPTPDKFYAFSADFACKKRPAMGASCFLTHT